MGKRIRMEKNLTIRELSQLMGITEVQVIRPLFEVMNIARTVNQRVSISVAKRLAEFLGYEVEEPS